MADLLSPRLALLLTPPAALIVVIAGWFGREGASEASLPADVQPAAQASAEAAPEVVLPPAEMTLGVRIRRGDTLGGLLGAHGLPVTPVREAALEHHDLAKIRPDRELDLVYRQGEAQAIALRYDLDEDRTLVVERVGEAWKSHVDEVEYDVEVGVRRVELTRSLWQDGLDAGLRPADLARLGRIFEYELDFNTELKGGATFDVVADVLTADGHKAKLGVIHVARIVNGDKTYTAVRHEIDGEDAYFHPDGSSMRRPFLRSPLEFSRVTSGFNPKRYHPILKKRRPHNGTDFGAPTGTPVRAVADGKVEYAGKSGGHGNYVKLDHEQGYDTSYSHLSRIKVKSGQRVKQGQIIGMVGSTGLATGPHLHYQMWKNGKYVDAMKVALPKQNPLPASQKSAFLETVAKWMPLLEGDTDGAAAADE